MSRLDSRRSDAPIRITLTVPRNNPRLLKGLDLWLHLGLLTNEQVRQIAQSSLCCSLPVVEPERGDDFAVETSLPPVPALNSAAGLQVPAFPSFIAQLLQSFRAELSVIWLLFLGVFLVIVSSGVLAASQWQNFSSIAQYTVLAAYTLAFWGASFWTSRRSNLRLTSQMLQIATLLLIPINFWLMDALQWQQLWGWVVKPIAALGLTAIMAQLLRPSLRNLPQPRLLLITSIALSWLHWGWQGTSFPPIATYMGTIAAAVALFFQEREEAESEDAEKPLAVGSVTVAIATLLLIARALGLAHVPIAQLGLAFGICGWLLCWLSRQHPARDFWTIAGASLLVLGWLVAVTNIPWQAIGVSGLAIWLYGERLIRQPKVQDVTAVFLIGLQAYGLLWRVIPADFRPDLLAFCSQIFGETFAPFNLAGIGFFPYIWAMLAFAVWLRRRSELAKHTDRLTLILGSGATLLSLTNPLLRSLNLILSALTLGWAGRNRQSPPLIYLTHLAGIGAIGSTIDWLFPNLNADRWAVILLVGMLAEWGFSIGSNRLQWRRSAWHIGLGLAGFSYVLLGNFASNWGAIWLVVPLALTGLAFGRSFPPAPIAPWISSAALLLVQPLTFDSTAPRLVSLGLATALMLLNTQKLQHRLAAVLTVGFGISFTIALSWQLFVNRLASEWQITLLAIVPFALWLLWNDCRRRDSNLSRLYGKAADGWAIGLSGFILLLLTAYTGWLYLSPQDNPQAVATAWLWATVLIVGAIVYRNFQTPHDFGFYGIALAVELLSAQLLIRLAPSVPDLKLLDITPPSDWLNLAIVNLALGLATQVAGDLRVSHSQQPYRSSWHIIPLTYALLGFYLSLSLWTATTGLYTLAAVLVGIGIGRRTPRFKFLSYLSLLGVSLAAYQLLIYQLLHAQSGSMGEGIVLLAGLAAILAIGYRFFAPRLIPYLRLSLQELGTIANLHWLASGGLLLLAWNVPLSHTGGWLGVGVAAILAVDALIQGRSQATWIYAGILAMIGAIGWALDLSLPNPELLRAWAGSIAAVFAYGMHQLPWATWGWAATPWRRSARLLPGAIVILTASEITIPALFIVAAFYALIAKTQVRLSYVSLLLADWAIVRWLHRANVQEPLWYAAVLGTSLLYIAQVDPSLQSADDREKRHWLRCLGVGLICLTGFYQSEADRGLALVTFGFSIALILAGLGLRIRALLYIGTATFVLQTLRQLWLLVADYSLLLWAIGIVLGLIFIWVAATFEARRSQVNALLSYWQTELESWE